MGLLTGWPSTKKRSVSLLNLIPLPYRILALALAVAALWGHGYFKGSSSKQAAFDAYRADIEAQVAIQRAKNDETVKRHQRDARTAQNDLKTRLSHINDAYSRLRDSAARMPSLAATVSGASACPEPQLAGTLERLETGVIGILERGDKELAKYQTLWELTNKR
jgi:hypothetical protein